MAPGRLAISGSGSQPRSGESSISGLGARIETIAGRIDVVGERELMLAMKTLAAEGSLVHYRAVLWAATRKVQHLELTGLSVHLPASR